MQAEHWIALAAIVASVLIAVATQIVTWRREKEQQARDGRLRREQLEREDRIREVERMHVPHIEFTIGCNAYGPELGDYLIELLLTAQNRGNTQQKFTNIWLRVRGIEGGQELGYWPEHEPRLNFPVELLDKVSIIPETYNYYFVEPGTTQIFTYVSKIPATTKYILAHAEFEYDQFTPHITERVFRVGT